MELAAACSTLGINFGMGAIRKALVLQQLPKSLLTFDILLSTNETIE